MEVKSDYIEDLKVIKKVMEESSRFLSLSGLSGVFAGIIALLASACNGWYIYYHTLLSAQLAADHSIDADLLWHRAGQRWKIHLQ